MSVARRLAGHCALVTALVAIPTARVHAEVAVVAVCYRGTPAGVPRQDDLALIRSLGFGAVVWPAQQTPGLPALRRLAQTVGLQVVTDTDDPVAPDAVVVPRGDLVRIRADRVQASAVPAIAWTAVANGTRMIAFDTGQASGLGVADDTGSDRPWVRPAVTFARQLSANATLFDALLPGPAVSVQSGDQAGVTVKLFGTPRLWVVVAANTGRRAADVVARLHPTVPYALWTSLFDMSTMSMLSEPAGPRWSILLAAGQAVVYFTDRNTGREE